MINIILKEMNDIQEVIVDYCKKFISGFDHSDFHQMMNLSAKKVDITEAKIMKNIFCECLNMIKYKYKLPTYIVNEIILQIVEVLINIYGYDIHFQNEFVLSWAYNNNDNLPLTKFLLEHGANPNSMDTNTITRVIILEKNLDIFKLYVDHGLDIRHPNILWSAIYHNRPNVIKFLIDAGIEIMPQSFIMAVQRNDILIVKLFIEYGCNVNCNDGQAMIMAIDNQNSDMVQLLLENGATIPKVNLKESDATKICDMLRNHNVDESTIIKLLIHGMLIKNVDDR